MMSKRKVKIVFRSNIDNSKLFSVKITRELYEQCLAALRPDETFEEFVVRAIESLAGMPEPTTPEDVDVPWTKWASVDEWESGSLSFAVKTGEKPGDASITIRQTHFNAEEAHTTTFWANLSEEDKWRLSEALTMSELRGLTPPTNGSPS